MGDRLQEFLKTSGKAQSCKAFVEDRKKLIEDITSRENFETQLRYHKALSNKTRFIIYQIIQEEMTCNCALSKILGLSEGSITHHLKILEKADLILGRNKGHFVHYYSKENMKKELSE